jgi:hypothetical protein
VRHERTVRRVTATDIATIDHAGKAGRIVRRPSARPVATSDIAAARRSQMQAGRSEANDEIVDCQMPEGPAKTIRSGFSPASSGSVPTGDDHDLRLYRRDREDVPQTPLAEREPRGA